MIPGRRAGRLPPPANGPPPSAPNGCAGHSRACPGWRRSSAARSAGIDPSVRPGHRAPIPTPKVMKMGDGGFRPADNGQLTTEVGSGIVVGVAVTNQGSDRFELEPLVERLPSP